jgi:SprT protein
MSKKEVSFSALEPYLPAGSLEAVLHYIHINKVQLTITRSRASVLGDYRHAHNGMGHRISVNGDLNRYSFLITLLHELAHLITFEKHGKKAAPHGREWKFEFGLILKEFVDKKVFPHDVETTLLSSLRNPAASSCGDEKLLRVLKKYDAGKEGVSLLEDLPAGGLFKIKGGRVFEKGEKIRTRFKCREVATGKWYLFSPVYEVAAAGAL